MLLSFPTFFMALISRVDSAESNAAAAATLKHKYKEQVEVVKILGSTEQVIQYIHLLKMSHYYTI